MFVYDVLLEHVEIGNTSISSSELSSTYNNLQGDAGLYANTTLMDAQFEVKNMLLFMLIHQCCVLRIIAVKVTTRSQRA